VNFYESVVIDYLRADRKVFVNTEYLIQSKPEAKLDKNNPHWYCDAVALDFHLPRTIFLCEISYAKGLPHLKKRLKNWHINWEDICKAVKRDSLLMGDQPAWKVRPWLFVQKDSIADLLKSLKSISAEEPLAFLPKITTLEMVQPWKYDTWNRAGEKEKPTEIPESMHT
jgi:hypothetical protein